MSRLRENWRIVMLVAFLLASTLAIFAPMLGSAGSTVEQSERLAGGEHTVELSDTRIELSDVSVTVADSDGPIEVTDGSISISGSQTARTDSGASVTNGTVEVSGGSMTLPNTDSIQISDPDEPANGSIVVGSGTIETTDTSASLSVSNRKWTNIEYGLDLDGGTRLRAPPVGHVVEDVGVQSGQSGTVTRQIADELGVGPVDVNVRQRSASTAAVEVFDRNVTQSQISSALQELGYDVSEGDVERGITQETRQTLIDTLEEKVNRGGLSGGTVAQTSGGGENFVVVEVPGATRSEVVNLVGDRGSIQIVAEVHNANGTLETRETVLTGDDMDVGQIGPREGTNAWEITVSINNDDAAERYQNRMRELGFTSPEGIGNCGRNRPGQVSGESYCLVAVLDGEAFHSNSMGPGLAEPINRGEFADDPGFTIGADNQTIAETVRVNLQVGALPTNLDIQDRGTVLFRNPSLAQEFKPLALLTGLIAWLGVTAMVFLRYKKPRVAVPMLFTAIAEVFILLGFAAIIKLPLDLSHIAGLIAVIGTGVDDLIIIADEILQQGKVATGKIFESRFRKAFWVIGAAAATTIIAMSPLAVLSLGDLQGFAIVTIVGVLIGVLITRPAYGDILRNLVLSEDQR